MNKLHVDSIRKTYGYKSILSDIFISCSEGEIIALLGKNGAGKSTLMKIIFGSVRADNKFVKVNDKIITNLYDSKNLIKYLPQENFLPNHVKIKKIIDLFTEKRFTDIISDNRIINPFINKKVKDLSGGEQRILEVLLIIYSEAKFILLDEPFNGIAPIHIDEIKNAIIEQSVKKGFLISDHDYKNVFDISTKKILLHAGIIKEIRSERDLYRWGYIPESFQFQ